MKKGVAIIIVAVLLGLVFTVYILNQQSGASIYNYLPYIFGSVSFLGGLYSLLFSFRIYKPKYETEEQQIRADDLIKKRGRLMKVGSIFLILWGTYNLISHDPNIYRLTSRTENSNWTNADKEKFIKSCVKEVSPTVKDHPQLIVGYCTCLIDKTMKEMSKQQYLEYLSLPKQEQNNKFNPVFQGCKINFNHQIDSAEKQMK